MTYYIATDHIDATGNFVGPSLLDGIAFRDKQAAREYANRREADYLCGSRVFWVVDAAYAAELRGEASTEFFNVDADGYEDRF